MASRTVTNPGNIINPRDTEEALRFRREIGELLKARREYLGVSRAEMGELLGVTEKGYGHYETGHSEMIPSKLAKAAERLGVSVAYFFGEVPEAEIADRDVMRYYNGLPPTLQIAARQQLKALFDIQDQEAKALEPPTHGKRNE